MFGCEPKDMTKDQYNTVCERLEKEGEIDDKNTMKLMG